MVAESPPSYPLATIVLGGFLALAALTAPAQSPQVKPLIAYVQEQLGLNEQQVRVGLGALLVFARDRLPKPDFDQLAQRMPNAEAAVEQTKARGIVTRSIDDSDEFVAVLERAGIPPTAASQFGATVLNYFGAAGYDQERDILSRVLD